MADAAADPYAVLGVPPAASDEDLRRAYRELVKRHHPDHNGGSPESASRFERIQSAYALITQRRAHDGGAAADIDDRLAAIERELAAQRAAASAGVRADSKRGPQSAAPRRPTPEELGHYTTDDSLAKIIDDAADQLAARLRASGASGRAARRLSDFLGRRE